MELPKYTHKHFYLYDKLGKAVNVMSFKSLLEEQIKDWEFALKEVNHAIRTKLNTIQAVNTNLTYNYEKDCIILDLQIKAFNENKNFLSEYNFLIEDTNEKYLQDFSIGQTIEEIASIISEHHALAKLEDFRKIQEKYINMLLCINMIQE